MIKGKTVDHFFIKIGGIQTKQEFNLFLIYDRKLDCEENKILI